MRPLPREGLMGNSDPEIREQAGYPGRLAHGFGCVEKTNS